MNINHNTELTIWCKKDKVIYERGTMEHFGGSPADYSEIRQVAFER
jgi:hypothetical protein